MTSGQSASGSRLQLLLEPTGLQGVPRTRIARDIHDEFGPLMVALELDVN